MMRSILIILYKIDRVDLIKKTLRLVLYDNALTMEEIDIFIFKYAMWMS